MKKKIAALLLAAMMCTLAACGAKDATADDETNDKDTLVVAMELAYPPFETKDADGNPSGVSVDFAKAFGEYIGKDVVIENIAWDGLIPALQTGKADMVMSSMTITDERKRKGGFLRALCQRFIGASDEQRLRHHLYRGYECRGTQNRRQNRLDRLFLCAEKSAQCRNYRFGRRKRLRD